MSALSAEEGALVSAVDSAASVAVSDEVSETPSVEASVLEAAVVGALKSDDVSGTSFPQPVNIVAEANNAIRAIIFFIRIPHK